MNITNTHIQPHFYYDEIESDRLSYIIKSVLLLSITNLGKSGNIEYIKEKTTFMLVLNVNWLFQYTILFCAYYL